jgi:hypothetical protein
MQGQGVRQAAETALLSKQKKKKASAVKQHSPISISLLLCVLSCFEASAAVNRSVAGGLESNLRLTAALCAGGDEVLSGRAACVLLCVAASLAALRLVHKALLFVELLLACSEYEFVAAFLANQSFVLKDLFCASHHDFLVHCLYLTFIVIVFARRRISTDTFEIFNALD